MQALLLSLLFLIGCSNPVIQDFTITEDTSVSIKNYKLLLTIEVNDNKFVLTNHDTVIYTFYQPLHSYGIERENSHKFYEYCNGYNSAVKIVYESYLAHASSVVNELNKRYFPVTLDKANEILYIENIKLYNSTERSQHLLDMQRCQNGFMNKTISIIPSRYFKDMFLYELQSSDWFATSL
jgi:hypothetical protein